MTAQRKMLSDWDAPYIQKLVKLIETQSKSTLANWAVGYAEKVILPIWSFTYPEDDRPAQAICAARDWLSGEIKLPAAKQKILLCHEAARDVVAAPAARAAARAIGQSTSTIHSARHCIGLPLYGALAVAYDILGTQSTWAELEAYASSECERMLEALRAISVRNETDPAKIDWKC